MSSEYAGASTYHATVTVVDDADPPVAASFAAGLQDVADRTASLKNTADAVPAAIQAVQDDVDALAVTVTGHGTNFDRLAQVVPGFGLIDKKLFSVWPIINVDPSELQRNTTGNVLDSEPASRIVAIMPLPQIQKYATIVGVSFTVKGWYYAAIPTTAAKVELVERNPVTMTETVKATAIDTSADLTAWSNWHTPTVACSVVAQSLEYYLRLYSPSGEGGADAVEFGAAWVSVY